MPFPTYAATIEADHPIAFWRGDGDFPGTDLSTFTPGPTSDGATAEQTSGVNTPSDGGTPSIISTGYTGTPNGPAGPFTIEFWFNFPGWDLSGGINPSPSYLLASSSYFEGGLALTIGTGGANFYTGAAIGGQEIISKYVPTLNAWHHCVVRFNGTIYQVFFDTSPTETCGAPTTFNTTLALSFGALITGEGEDGPISQLSAQCAYADIALYKYALSDAQICAHYGAASAMALPGGGIPLTQPYPKAVLFDRPVFYARCDETGGNRAFDSSGKSNHGAYIGDVQLGDTSEITSGTDACIGLDGETAVVTTPVQALGSFGKFSLELLFYAVNVPSGPLLLCGTQAGNAMADLPPTGPTLLVDASGNLTASIGYGDVLHEATAYGAIEDTTWYYVAVTYDLATLRLYINGSLAATASVSDMPDFAADFSFGGYVSYSSDGAAQPLWLLEGNLDELALYNYALTPARIAAHYAAIFGPPPPPPTYYTANNDEHYWLVKIYDKAGNLVDIPQDDVVDFAFGRTINGGPDSNSSLKLRRNIDNIGEIAFLYNVQFWVWNGRIPQPVDPWWSGFMQDIDTQKLKTDGEVTVSCVGNAMLLNRAITDQLIINPGVAGNPNWDAASFLAWLLTRYAPPDFGNVDLPSSMFNLLPQQMIHIPLGQAIDQVCKSGRDDTGLLYVWRVDADAQLNRTLLVQVDQNPNVLDGPKFIHLFGDGSFVNYKMTTKYRDIVNVVLVTGGTDPTTNQQVEVVVEDDASISEWGPIEGVVSVPGLLSVAAAQAFGAAWLDVHGNAQGSGELELAVPNPAIIDDTWIQIWETPTVVKQMRVGSVKCTPKGNRVRMVLSPVAPTPYIDAAVYKIAQGVSQSTGNAISNLPVNTQTQYVRSGFTVTETT